jgi:1-acyl-sn-glycerol-3-phosphate acyltransferase
MKASAALSCAHKVFDPLHLAFPVPRLARNLAALAFLIAFSIIVLAYLAYQLCGPGRYNVWERILYAPVYFLARVLWRVEVEWRDARSIEDPRHARGTDWLLSDRIQTGALLIANHRCSLDPFFVQLVSGKRVHWMVAGEYFRHFLFGPILRWYQAIPTNRAGVDTASTKKAIALAKSGRFVGMFPEGRINRTDAPLLSIRPGAALVAIKADVPIVPIWIEGAPRGWEVYSALFMPAKVRVIVGAPSRFSKSTDDCLVASGDNESNSDSKRALQRQEAVNWMTRVMQQSLQLGGSGTETVDIAGSKWVDS